MTKKFYVVRVGRIPGIYETWSECERMVKGYKGAVYRSFLTLAEAKKFMGDNLKADDNTDDNTADDTPYAFVDGSYNSVTKVYGYGGFLIYNGEKHIIQGSGNDEEMAAMRNVAGEVLGSMAAVELAVKLGIPKLDIYYDYMGIEMWATGRWKRNKKGTIAYYNYMQEIKDKIDIRFVKVKGHSGIAGNEEADALAKQSVGIE